MSALVEGGPFGRNTGGAERHRRPALTIGERKSSVLGEPPQVRAQPDPARAVCGRGELGQVVRQPLPLQPARPADPMESLILAQDKRWRRALRMQVERPPQLRLWRGVANG